MLIYGGLTLNQHWQIKNFYDWLSFTHSTYLITRLRGCLELASTKFYKSSLEYERVYLPLYKVADTPFHIPGEEVYCTDKSELFVTCMIKTFTILILLRQGCKKYIFVSYCTVYVLSLQLEPTCILELQMFSLNVRKYFQLHVI